MDEAINTFFTKIYSCIHFIVLTYIFFLKMKILIAGRKKKRKLNKQVFIMFPTYDHKIEYYLKLTETEMIYIIISSSFRCGILQVLYEHELRSRSRIIIGAFRVIDYI